MDKKSVFIWILFLIFLFLALGLAGYYFYLTKIQKKKTDEKSETTTALYLSAEFDVTKTPPLFQITGIVQSAKEPTLDLTYVIPDGKKNTQINSVLDCQDKIIYMKDANNIQKNNSQELSVQDALKQIENGKYNLEGLCADENCSRLSRGCILFQQ